LARNVLTRLDVQDVVLDREREAATDHVFSKKIAMEGEVTSQGSSGRCWLFAALNVVRLEMMNRLQLRSDFELSQSFLYFYDKLERANYFLCSILRTIDDPVDTRVVSHLLSAPMNDGGQWSMMVNLVAKYGLVPKLAYPDSAPATNSRPMNWALTLKLREFAAQLRAAFRKGTPFEELVARKEGMLATVHSILLAHLGAPPQRFDWCYYDSKGVYHEHRDLTPRTFMRDFVEVDLTEYVSLVHDPRNEYGQVYTVEYLGNVVEGDMVRYVNAPIDAIRNAVVATIDAGEPVWFGCEVAKFLAAKKASMDLRMFDYKLLLGTELGMSKEDRLLYGESCMTHAMVFTGYDRKEGDERPRKYRVENSWGAKRGAKGYFVMTDEWFDEYVFQVAIHKKYLPPELVEAVSKSPVYLPPWDPMGALAE